jgi:hypothetical protein
MWINTPNARLAIGARRGLRLKAARGATLRAVQGTLWVTIDNDRRDIVLDPGESFVVDSNQPLVVMPLGECATLDVRSGTPAHEPVAHTIGAWLSALWRRGAVAQASSRSRPVAA